MERLTRWLPAGVFSITLIVWIAGAAGGPGWDGAAGHAVLAARLEHAASAPLYGVLAGAWGAVPVGELGFRLALLGAVLGAATVAGVVRAAAALLPKDPLAGAVGAVLLVLAPTFREATGFATPSALAMCGTVWTVVGLLDHARARAADGASSHTGARQAAFTLAMIAVVIGASPWLGAALTVIGVGLLARDGAARGGLAIGAAGLGAFIVVLWLRALGPLPGIAPDLSSMVAGTGRGAAAVVVGAGLLGAAFGVATGLRRATTLALVIAATVIHAIVIDPSGAPVLASLAIAVAILPSAVVRLLTEVRREVVVAGAPLIAVALLAGPSAGVDPPGAAPARLASDVIDALPPGPGVIVARSGTTWTAIHYAQQVAGARPDLALVPPVAATIADGVVADALRAGQIVGADVPSFGRLDPSRARPRGRGFQLEAAPPPRVPPPPPPPATYASATGRVQASLLALARARYEVRAGRLDAAARAAGLTARFGAADLALLASANWSRDRPALFGFVATLDVRPAGPWLLELLGDDLVWIAGLDAPVLPEDAGVGRRLHALWRLVLAGTMDGDDPQIAALGTAAITATTEMLAAIGR